MGLGSTRERVRGGGEELVDAGRAAMNPGRVEHLESVAHLGHLTSNLVRQPKGSGR